MLAFTVGWPPLAEADITRMMTGGLTYPTATLDKSQASLSVRLHYIDTPDRSRPSAGNMRAIGCYLRAHDSGRAGCNSSPIPQSKVNATRRLVEARLYATWPAAVQQSYRTSKRCSSGATSSCRTSEAGFASFIPLFGGFDFLAVLEREAGKIAPKDRDSLAKGAHMGLVLAGGLLAAVAWAAGVQAAEPKSSACDAFVGAWEYLPPSAPGYSVIGKAGSW